MIEIYAKLIKAGLRTLEEVPSNIREEVRLALEQG
jgi:hypothetical protein